MFIVKFLILSYPSVLTCVLGAQKNRTLIQERGQCWSQIRPDIFIHIQTVMVLDTQTERK